MSHSLSRLRRDAKALKKSHASGNADAHRRVGRIFPAVTDLKHADALHVARAPVRSDPEFWVVLYGLTRRSIYRHLRDNPATMSRDGVDDAISLPS